MSKREEIYTSERFLLLFYGKKVSERTALYFESTLKTDELHKMEYFGCDLPMRSNIDLWINIGRELLLASSSMQYLSVMPEHQLYLL